MSVVVGCRGCGRISQVPAGRVYARCQRCKLLRVLLLDVDENQERWRRGLPLDEWFEAPRAPATRAGCELPRGDRPCPHLRCRYHLGNPGDRGCALDVAERGGATLAEVGGAIGYTVQRVQQIAAVAIAKRRTA